MKDILQNLIKLQSIEFSETKGKNAVAAMSELRGKIPPQILGHYDRLVARGKKASRLFAIRPALAAICACRSAW